MTDAYRTAARCPGCGNAVMHEFAHRLLCDHCAGVLLTVADFTSSLRELGAPTSELEITDGEPVTSPCPRCGGALRRCKLRFGKTQLKEDFLHCAQDGVWMSQDAMVTAFARVSRAAGPRGAGPQIVVNAAAGTPAAAMAGVRDAFGGGLLIGGRQPNRPRVHTLFASAYAGQRLGCPACADAELHAEGDRWACAACAGAFVETAALVAMVEDITGAPWQAPAPTGAAGARSCPVCKAAMRTDKLDGVELDRCETHGTWFDAGELGQLLQHASDPPKSHAGWLRHLFHRG